MAIMWDWGNPDKYLLSARVVMFLRTAHVEMVVWMTRKD